MSIVFYVVLVVVPDIAVLPVLLRLLQGRLQGYRVHSGFFRRNCLNNARIEMLVMVMMVVVVVALR
jgi:hypothetical protein